MGSMTSIIMMRCTDSRRRLMKYANGYDSTRAMTVAITEYSMDTRNTYPYSRSSVMLPVVNAPEGSVKA